MKWHSCFEVMPGNKCDKKANPGECKTFFMVYYKERKIPSDTKIDKAILHDGKFIVLGHEESPDDIVISHWMHLDYP